MGGGGSKIDKEAQTFRPSSIEKYSECITKIGENLAELFKNTPETVQEIKYDTKFLALDMAFPDNMSDLKKEFKKFEEYIILGLRLPQDHSPKTLARVPKQLRQFQFMFHPFSMKTWKIAVFETMEEVFDDFKKNEPRLVDETILQVTRTYMCAWGIELVYNPKKKFDQLSLNDAMTGYILSYPYFDNFVDDPTKTIEEKLVKLQGYRKRLLTGERFPIENHIDEDLERCFMRIEKTWKRETNILLFWSLVKLLDNEVHALKQKIKIKKDVKKDMGISLTELYERVKGPINMEKNKSNSKKEEEEEVEGEEIEIKVEENMVESPKEEKVENNTEEEAVIEEPKIEIESKEDIVEESVEKKEEKKDEIKDTVSEDSEEEIVSKKEEEEEEEEEVVLKNTDEEKNEVEEEKETDENEVEEEKETKETKEEEKELEETNEVVKDEKENTEELVDEQKEDVSEEEQEEDKNSDFEEPKEEEVSVVVTDMEEEDKEMVVVVEATEEMEKVEEEEEKFVDEPKEETEEPAIEDKEETEEPTIEDKEETEEPAIEDKEEEDKEDQEVETNEVLKEEEEEEGGGKVEEEEEGEEDSQAKKQTEHYAKIRGVTPEEVIRQYTDFEVVSLEDMYKEVNPYEKGVKLPEYINDEFLTPTEVMKSYGSVLCSAYTLMKDVSLDMIEWLSFFGFLLQMTDDLQDIEEDLHAGTVTIFTSRILRGEKLDTIVIKWMNFLIHNKYWKYGYPYSWKSYDPKKPKKLRKLSKRERKFREIMKNTLVMFCMFAIGALNPNYFSKDFHEKVKPIFPIPPHHLRMVMGTFDFERFMFEDMIFHPDREGLIKAVVKRVSDAIETLMEKDYFSDIKKQMKEKMKKKQKSGKKNKKKE